MKRITRSSAKSLLPAFPSAESKLPGKNAILKQQDISELFGRNQVNAMTKSEKYTDENTILLRENGVSLQNPFSISKHQKVGHCSEMGYVEGQFRLSSSTRPGTTELRPTTACSPTTFWPDSTAKTPFSKKKSRSRANKTPLKKSGRSPGENHVFWLKSPTVDSLRRDAAPGLPSNFEDEVSDLLKCLRDDTIRAESSKPAPLIDLWLKNSSEMKSPITSRTSSSQLGPSPSSHLKSGKICSSKSELSAPAKDQEIENRRGDFESVLMGLDRETQWSLDNKNKERRNNQLIEKEEIGLEVFLSDSGNRKNYNSLKVDKGRKAKSLSKHIEIQYADENVDPTISLATDYINENTPCKSRVPACSYDSNPYHSLSSLTPLVPSQTKKRKRSMRSNHNTPVPKQLSMAGSGAKSPTPHPRTILAEIDVNTRHMPPVKSSQALSSNPKAVAKDSTQMRPDTVSAPPEELEENLFSSESIFDLDEAIFDVIELQAMSAYESNMDTLHKKLSPKKVSPQKTLYNKEDQLSITEDFGDIFDMEDIDIDAWSALDDEGEIDVLRPQQPEGLQPCMAKFAFDSANGCENSPSGEDSIIDSNERPKKRRRKSINVENMGRDSQAELQKKKTFTRCLVLEVNLLYFISPDGTQKPEKVLRLYEERECSQKYVRLREDWWGTNVNVGDYINIIGPFNPDSQTCIIDNSQNLLVLHPDVLMTCTKVADSFSCLRKAVLEDRIRFQGDTNEAMVQGRMLHELLQSGLRTNDWSSSTLEREIDTIIANSISDLYLIGQSEEGTKKKLLELVGVMQSWAAKFVTSTPKPEAIVMDSRTSTNDHVTACINRIFDIEEHIWSPMYGIKGQIDVSVQAMIKNDPKYGLAYSRTEAIPFEAKTGQNLNMAIHRAQTMLYMLLMTDRYSIDVESGLLYYLRTGETVLVSAARHEVRSLIMGRNLMASYLISRDKLPPMLKNLHTCQRCNIVNSCIVYHKTLENGTAESSGLGTLFNNKTAHLTSKHANFFEKWEQLISLEESDMKRFQKEIWSMTSAEREKIGRCLSNLVLDLSSSGERVNDSKWLRYKFIRKPNMGPSDTTSVVSFLNSFISINDPIVISSEQGHFNLAVGFVREIQPDSIIVNVDRYLQGPPMRDKDFDEFKKQTFLGIMDVKDSSVLRRPQECETVYRVDKDELTSGMGIVRNNLLELFTENGDEKRRRLIVDLEPPRFDVRKDIDFNAESLNVDQKKALGKVLAARDYALILGMPGTGKTTTIMHIIKVLLARKKSILLTSYTHTAVDNVLLKLKTAGIDILRLGSFEKVHPEIRDCLPDTKNRLETVSALKKFYNSKLVVATTCLNISEIAALKRKFDYCIVDEASQLTLPVCLGPLRFAETFVLVGDHYQLPPLVRNSDAKKDGLTVSLFKLLSEVHPEAVVNLEHQYRMNRDIMLLSNTLIYDYKLRCGTALIAEDSLKIPCIGNLGILHKVSPQFTTSGVSVPPCNAESCWLRTLLDPSRKAVFVDTDKVPAVDSRSSDLVQNETEAMLILHIVEALLTCGVEQTSLGIISVYRSQLKLISHLLQPRSGIEIHTVDRYQGRDKDCVIVSLVRSNEKQNVGELLRDWRRINVAFTRARKKLIIIGSKSTLEGTHLFDKFLKLMQSQNWIFCLPMHAHLLHSVNIIRESNSAIDNPEKSALTDRSKVINAKVEVTLKGRNIIKNIIDGI